MVERKGGDTLTDECNESCGDRDEHGDEVIPSEVEFPVEDVLDLHTFRPGEVGDLIPDYLSAAWEKGYREVRIIHGKGTGILRERVHALLRKHSFVVSFRLADADAGGWGATVVMLSDKSHEST